MPLRSFSLFFLLAIFCASALAADRRAEGFRFVQQTLQQCSASPESMAPEVLATLRNEPTANWNCAHELQNFPTLDGLIRHMHSIERNVYGSDLGKALYDRAFQNIVDTYADLNLGFENRAGSAANQLCKRMEVDLPQGCSRTLQASLEAEERSYSEKFRAAGRHQLSLKDAAKVINKLIEKANAAKTPAERWAYLSQSPATLIFTSTLIQVTGNPLTQKMLHPWIAPDALAVAVDEARFSTLKNLENLNVGSHDGIKKAIYDNPSALADVLSVHPEFASTLCPYFSELSSDAAHQRAHDALVRNLDRGVGWGGLIVGGALTLTGVFSEAGIPIIAGSEGALATVGTVATVMSVTEAGASATYHGVRMHQAANEEAAIESGVLSHNAGESSADRMRYTQADFDESFHELRAAGLNVTLSSGAVAVLAKTGKMVYATALVKTIARSKPISAALKAAENEKVDIEKVVQKLVGEDEGSVRKVLAKMSSWRPNDFRRFIGDRVQSVKSDPLALIWKKAGTEGHPPRSASQWMLHPWENSIETTLGKIYKPLSNIGRSGTVTDVAVYWPWLHPITLLHRWAQAHGQEKVRDDANRIKYRIPGSEYVLRFPALDPATAAQIVVDHDRFLSDWLKDQSGKKLLPRIEELRKLGYLDDSNARHVNEIAHRAMSDVSEQGVPGSHFIFDVQTRFAHLMAEHPDLLRAGVNAEIFNPLIQIGRFTDLQVSIEATRRAAQDNPRTNVSTLLSPSRQNELQNRSMANVIRLSREAGADGESIFFDMGIHTLVDPASIRAKIVRASSFFPKDRLDTVARPDIPNLSVSKDGPGIHVTDELSRWRLILTDSRFRDLAAQWKNRKSSDLDTLVAAEVRIAELSMH